MLELKNIKKNKEYIKKAYNKYSDFAKITALIFTIDKL